MKSEIKAADLSAQPTCSASLLVWSPRTPDIEGLYWERMAGSTKQIVELVSVKGRLSRLFYGLWTPLDELPKSWYFEWAGPISEPIDPQNAKGEAREALPPTTGSAS